MAKKVKKGMAKDMVKGIKDHVQEALEDSNGEEDYAQGIIYYTYIATMEICSSID